MTQLTPADVLQLRTMLNNGDRTGMYLRYYELTGSQQALEQAQISSFSGIIGGAALNANLLVQITDQLFGQNVYPGTIEDFSVRVATHLLDQIDTSVTNNQGGVFTDQQILGFAQDAWTEAKLPGSFPGHAFEALDALQEGDFSGFWDHATSAGTVYGVVGMWYELETLGLLDNSPIGSLSDFLSSRYAVQTTPDGSVQYIIDLDLGRTVHVSRSSDIYSQFFPTLHSYAELLNNVAAVFPEVTAANFASILNYTANLLEVTQNTVSSNFQLSLDFLNGLGINNHLAPTSTNNGFTISNIVGTPQELINLALPSSYLNGLALTGGNWQVNLSGSILNGNGLANVSQSFLLTGGWRPGAGELSDFDFVNDVNSVDSIWNQTGYSFYDSTMGIFNASVATRLARLAILKDRADLLLNIDPLVLDISGNGIQLNSYRDADVLFNMDDDAYKEQTGWTKNGTGFLVLDKNGDGVINDISEIFSEYFTPNAKNGLAALATLDLNHDGVFNASDVAFSQVRVWQDANGNGQTDTGELATLAALGITSISLAGVAGNGALINGNEVQATSTMVINGLTHAVAAVNLLTNPNGQEWDLGAQGVTMHSESGSSSFSVSDMQGMTVNITALGVGDAYGNAGNDTLIGDGNANWLGGGGGSDTFIGGAGDDVLIIDAKDLQANIDGGSGFDIVQAVGDEGVNFNLSLAHVELAYGSANDDILVGGGTSSVYIAAGAGNDFVIGSGANDALSGNDGDDILDGGYGDDIIRGGRGDDLMIGGAGNDVMEGGLGDDILQGNDGNDVFVSNGGTDTIDGGAGDDVVQFSGNYFDYTRTVLADGRIVMSDKVAGRDGVVTLKNVEYFNFDNLLNISATTANPMPARDTLFLIGTGAQTILAATLLANDIDYQNNTLHLTTVSDAVGGTVALDASGNVVFTPTAGYEGIYSFSYNIADSLNNSGLYVKQLGTTTAAEMKGVVTLLPSSLPSDPLLASQWYLTDANITPVWKDYTGAGVKVGVFDPSGVFDYNHADLAANAASSLEGSTSAISTHSTLVAGVIGAARNGIGGVGVAYNAQMDAQQVSIAGDELANFKQYDVVNNSWIYPAFSLNFITTPGLQNFVSLAASVGRDYSGTVMVFAAGNDRASGGDANTSGLNASRWGIQVGAINQSSDIGSLVPAHDPFSNHGASILVSAPGSNVTSTSQLFVNQDGANFGGDYETAQGTSFATPIVSGIAALMLEANASLGYRDVQEILAYSAKFIYDLSTTWQVNHATDWNGGGMHYSNDYGFGEVDALAAVRLAETWTRTQTADNEVSTVKNSGAVNAAVPDGSGSLVKTLTVTDAIKIEHVEVVLNLTSAQLGDLIVTLIAPDGTESVLLNRLDKAPGTSDTADRGYGTLNDSLLLNSTHDWGENSAGTWQLKIEDKAGNQITTLNNWELRLYGAEESADNTYIYTNEFAWVADTQRQTLTDSVGTDTINISAVRGNSYVDLTPGHTSTIVGNTLTMGSSTLIENVYAGDGDDILIGNDGNNYLWGGRGNDTINGGAGDDILEGNAGANTLTGGAGNDMFEVLKSAGASDTITDFSLSERIFFYGYTNPVDFAHLTITQNGADAVVHLEDGQTITLQNITAASLTAANFITGVTITGTSGNDFITGGIGSDILNGGAGDDVIAGESNNVGNIQGSSDIINGGDGNDTLVGGAANDVIHGDAGNDAIEGDHGNDALYGDAGNDTMQGNWGADTLDGGAGQDSLYGNEDNDSLTGGADADTLYGGDGNDTLLAGADTTATGGGDTTENTLVGNAGDDILYGAGGNDTLYGSEGSDTLYGGDGNDNLISGLETTGAGDVGNNIVHGGNGNDLIYGAQGNDTLYGDAGNDTIAGGLGADVIFGGDGNDILQGEFTFDAIAGGNDTLYGGNGDDVIAGGFGDDFLSGDAGNDSLNGGLGNDVISGGAGVVNDLYGGANADRFLIHARYGSDLDVIWDFDANDQSERLDLSEFGVDGTSWGTRLFYASGSYVADGQTFTGTWIFVRNTPGTFNASTIITDPAFQKIFLVNVTPASLNDYSLLFTHHDTGYAGTDSGDTLTGSADNDVMYGGGGNDQISGGDGNDQLHGQGGDDILSGGYGSDVIDGGAGNNTADYSEAYSGTTAGITVNLATGINHWLSAEGDILLNIQNIVGSAYADSLTGDANDNRLEGGAGADTLAGGGGIDTASYLHSNAAVSINLLTNTHSGGHAAGDSLDGIENILGSAYADTITGDAQNNLLEGGAGADTLNGGSGIDTASYASSNAAVTVNLATNVNLNGHAAGDVLTSMENILGSAFNDSLTGNSANNLLDGGAGDDSMAGGTGDDRYIVDTLGDAVTENASEGTDTVVSGVHYTLGSNLENLVLSGTAALNGTGNALNNTLTGNSGDNILDGGAGNDVMEGGMGDDMYYVDAAGDTVTETVNEGTDVVMSSVSYTLTNNVENLTLSGTGAINATGNALNNVLTGNSGNNVLDGGAGNDNMAGGIGNDSYVVESAGDSVIEHASEGTDTVTSAISYVLGENIENLILSGTAGLSGTGNALNNVLTGNSGENILDGGTGNDTMVGGAGNDSYMVDSIFDTVTENASEGTDLVTSSVSYTLSNHVENLVLSGTSAINATGNALNNILTGNSGTNILDGGAGDDTMVGGAGNDSYMVDSTGDVVTELANEGTDLVTASISYTLGANVENLTLSGISAINATGNALNNTLTGNSGNNVLDGGTGDDLMAGGAGDDTYQVDSTGDVVTENASEGNDTVSSSINYTLGAQLENLILTGAALTAVGNALNNSLTGNSSDNTLDGGAGNDTMAGGGGNDSYIVDSISDVVTENTNEGTDLVTSSVSYTLGNSIENLTLSGTGSITATGNGLNNVLTGNSGDNTLDGGTGNDTLTGGLGADLFIVNKTAGANTVITDFNVSTSGEKIQLLGFTNAVDFANLNIAQSGADTLITLENGQSLRLNNVTASLLTAAHFVGSSSGGSGAITGTAGNDTLTGTNGNDIINAGAGNDWMDGGAGADTIDGGSETDTISYAASAAAVTIDLSLTTGQSGGNAAGDILLNIENATGSAFNDSITSWTIGSVLDGGAGNDFLMGGNTFSTLNGGDGNDVLMACDGAFTVDGSGHHTVYLFDPSYVPSGASSTLNGGNGDDYILGGAGADILHGDAGNDGISAYGTDSVIDGGTGDDYIEAHGDNNLIDGGDGDDTILYYGDGGTLNGGDGADYLAGGYGADAIDGGAGTDTVSYVESSDAVVIDLSSSSAQSGGDAQGDILSNIENVWGSGYDDILIGNSGANQLLGGYGADSLTGGSGGDRFVYQEIYDSGVGVGNRDIILDFSQLQGDQIDLSAFGDTFSFVGTSGFSSGSSPQVRFFDDGTNTIVQVDANHDMIADFDIQMNSHIALVSADFIW